MTQYLLDTNILVHFVRADSVWDRIRDEYDLFLADPTPIISIVTSGEVRSIGLRRKWGVRRISQLDFALGCFPEIPIATPALVDAYAAMDAYANQRGISLGKNDLWIAATAFVTGATLLTTDRDFDVLDGTFIHRIWVDPSPDS
jgi:tRNA(fMet)-specific endonuclease VapC